LNQATEHVLLCCTWRPNALTTGPHGQVIELGFSADKIVRSNGFKKKKVSERDLLGFRTDAKSGLKALARSYF